jgi:hypothetical protein
MAATVTRDVKVAKRYVVAGSKYAHDMRPIAHRAERRTEKIRLRVQGEDYAPAGKPRLTGWDII